MRIVIQAVRSRTPVVEYLTKHLPQAEVCWDTTSNAMLTFMAALKMAGDGPSLHLEDDIVLTKDFVSKVEAGIEVANAGARARGIPKPIVQFYSMRSADIEVGSRWDSNFSCNPCWYAPRGVDKELRDFFPVWMPRNREHPTGFDILIRDWVRRSGGPYWIHNPSLVQHRAGPSTLGPRSSRRVAKTFEDPETRFSPPNPVIDEMLGEQE